MWSSRDSRQREPPTLLHFAWPTTQQQHGRQRAREEFSFRPSSSVCSRVCGETMIYFTALIFFLFLSFPNFYLTQTKCTQATDFFLSPLPTSFAYVVLFFGGNVTHFPDRTYLPFFSFWDFRSLSRNERVSGFLNEKRNFVQLKLFFFLLTFNMFCSMIYIKPPFSFFFFFSIWMMIILTRVQFKSQPFYDLRDVPSRSTWTVGRGEKLASPLTTEDVISVFYV